MSGSATLTIVASRITISWAVAMTSNARPRWREPGPAPAVPVPVRPARGCADDMHPPWIKAVLNPRRGIGAAAHGSLVWEEEQPRAVSVTAGVGGCRRKALAPLAVRAGDRRADQDLAHLLSVLGGFKLGGQARRAPRLCGPGRDDLAEQAQQAAALIGVERLAPGQVRQDLVLQPLPQLHPGRGEHDPLAPPVGRIALTGGQPPLFQHVGDAGDEGWITVQPLAEVLHRHRAVKPLQRLEEEDRHTKLLRYLFRPREHRSEQLGHGFEDLGIHLVAGAVPGSHQHPPCPDDYS